MMKYFAEKTIITFDPAAERAVKLAEYIVCTGATVRAAAARFGVSKSTVHKDVTERLAHINGALAADVRRVLDVNKEERHLRGGLATRKKYRLLRRARRRTP